jgi:hypothetical protein
MKKYLGSFRKLPKEHIDHPDHADTEWHTCMHDRCLVHAMMKIEKDQFPQINGFPPLRKEKVDREVIARLLESLNSRGITIRPSRE